LYNTPRAHLLALLYKCPLLARSGDLLSFVAHNSRIFQERRLLNKDTVVVAATLMEAVLRPHMSLIQPVQPLDPALLASMQASIYAAAALASTKSQRSAASDVQDEVTQLLESAQSALPACMNANHQYNVNAFKMDDDTNSALSKFTLQCAKSAVSNHCTLSSC